jgi:pentatricopeptide repeat protein
LLCGQAGVKPNVRTYTALITALGNAKQWKRALHTLQRLKTDMSAARVEPNAYTYSALLKTMGEHGQWALAEQVLATCSSCFTECSIFQR